MKVSALSCVVQGLFKPKARHPSESACPDKTEGVVHVITAGICEMGRFLAYKQEIHGISGGVGGQNAHFANASY